MYFAPNPNMFRNSPSLMTIISFKEMLLGTIRNEDFQRNTAFQCWNNVVMLCCAKNRRCEQFRVTSPLNPQSDILQNSRYWINPDSLLVLGELNLHSGFQSIVYPRENSILLVRIPKPRIPYSSIKQKIPGFLNPPHYLTRGETESPQQCSILDQVMLPASEE